MNEKVEHVKKTANIWTGMFEKYEMRAGVSTEECCVPQVNYKHFVKPKVKKPMVRKLRNKINVGNTFPNICNADGGNLKEIDVSAIIDEDGSQDDETLTNNHFTSENLIQYIEIDLNSNLKVILSKRNESSILDADDYDYWDKCMKEEMKRIKKYITKTELKEYIRYCNNEAHINFKTLNDIIVIEMKSNIRELLIKREFVRDNKYKYRKYYQKVCNEWQKLREVLHVDWLTVYAFTIIKSIKKKKVQLSLIDGEGFTNS